MNEKLDRHLLAASVVPTGNPWLDDALFGGIDKSNLMMVAAKTGVGKTFFGVQLASQASAKARNVLYFALEAERFEIERRQLFYAITGILHAHYPTIPVPQYREWLHMGYDPQWDAIEKEAQKKLDVDLAYLKTEYRPHVYTPQEFKQDIINLVAAATDEDKPHLVILDHLHHFFLDGDEIDALKICIHSIKRMQAEFEVPIVVLAQLRKGDSSSFKNKGRSLPFLEDIRGTASLSDVATDVLIISPVPEDKKLEMPLPVPMPMYFHLAKSRTAAPAKNYAAICSFDPKKGGYDDRYTLTTVKNWEDPVITPSEELPVWAKRANRIKITTIEMREPSGAKKEYKRFSDD